MEMLAALRFYLFQQEEIRLAKVPILEAEGELFKV